MSELGKCVICQKNEATQKHHLSYGKDEMLISICRECHRKLHQHGVGLGRGLITKNQGEVQEEWVSVGRYTKINPELPKNPIVRIVDNQVLAWLICSCGHQEFQLFHAKEPDEFFIRCCQCGLDARIGEIE